MQRFAFVIGLKADKVEEYKQLHAAVWPEIAALITECQMRNYSIFLRQLPDGHHYLFGYFEYVGSNFKADMARMATDDASQRWASCHEPCQIPLDNRLPGEWWASMQEIFHQN